MDDQVGTGELERLFAQTRNVLESMRATRAETVDASDTGTAEADGDTASGEAFDGRIRAKAAKGRLTSLHLDPRVARMASVELAEQIVVAVNAALAAQEMSAVPTVPVDPAILAEQLRQAQDSSLRQMTQFGQAMDAVVAQLRRAGGQ